MATDDAGTAAGPQLADRELLAFLGVVEESLDAGFGWSRSAAPRSPCSR